MENTNYKKFILFWASQTISQLGSSMTGFALIISAYKQTNSAMSVSLLTFSSYLPYVIISLLAGAFVDQHKKKNIMLWSDTIAVLCSVFIIIMVFIDNLSLWHIYLANIITGFMNAFQSPASSVAVGLLIPKEKLGSASGMNSFSSSLLTVITPMLAGFISSFWGLKGVLFIDILTFVFASSVLFFFIKIPEKPKKTNTVPSNILTGCREGFTFLMHNKGLWYLILSMALLNFFSRLTYENILPAMILARSGGNDTVFGIISGLLGAGGILGGLYVSFFKLPHNPIKMIYWSAAISFILGDLLMGLGQNTYLWCIAGLAASVPIPFINAGISLILYNNITPDLQGRVFAVRNAVQYCTIPIGILLGGYLADYVFEPFMQSTTPLALFFQKIVGSGSGSGMAIMFLCTGILGFTSSVLLSKNKYIRKLRHTK